MIIKIAQTQSDIKQSFYVDSDGFCFNGTAGSFSRLEPIVLSNKQTELKGIHSFSKWYNYIPVRCLFGMTNRKRIFHLYKDGETYGKFTFVQDGFLKCAYEIELNSGDVFRCYYRNVGSFNYVMIYRNNTQIALIETYLNVENFKHNQKIYILDECNRFADTFSLFSLYYANYHIVKRIHLSKGFYTVKTYSFSKYNNMYDNKWREEHFPNENFFGKIHLFEESNGQN